MSADPQKYRLYEAERVFDGHRAVRHFRSLAEMQAFADRVVGSDWWKGRSKVEAVKVFLGRKDASKAKAYPRMSSWRGVTQTTPFVTMPPSWAATDVTLIHELAHICVGTHHRHGPKYAACYLDMMRKFGGHLLYSLLRDGFDEQRVAHGEGDEVKSTRQVEREAARERERPKLSPDDETFLRLIGM